MNEQPSQTVNCSCCGYPGERGDFYRDKLNDRYACVDIEGCIVRQKGQGQKWLTLDNAPFSTWILLLWYGGIVPHYEVALGTIVINPEFQQEQFWDGHGYRPMDRIVGWLPLPPVPQT